MRRGEQGRILSSTRSTNSVKCSVLPLPSCPIDDLVSLRAPTRFVPGPLAPLLCFCDKIEAYRWASPEVIPGFFRDLVGRWDADRPAACSTPPATPLMPSTWVSHRWDVVEYSSMPAAPGRYPGRITAAVRHRRRRFRHRREDPPDTGDKDANPRHGGGRRAQRRRPGHDRRPLAAWPSVVSRRPPARRRLLDVPARQIGRDALKTRRGLPAGVARRQMLGTSAARAGYRARRRGRPSAPRPTPHDRTSSWLGSLRPGVERRLERHPRAEQPRAHGVQRHLGHSSAIS